MTHGNKLRDRIAGPGTTPLIGVYDMYSASIAAQHYDGMFVSGFGFAASYYGLPDIGFIAWPDMMAFVQRLRGAFPMHHLLVDIDDGYVDPEVACHVVEGLERIGASGVILEDQKRPRRCGHADGKQVLPLREYLAKLEMVLAARQDLLVVARTDATDEYDILHRAESLAATDADVVLVDGVRSVEWIRRIRAVVGEKPLLFNQIAGGKSPRLSLRELSDLGVNVAIYSTPCLFAAHEAVHCALTELKRTDGRLPALDAVHGVGVATVTSLLEGNIARRRPAAEDAARSRETASMNDDKWAEVNAGV
ncbi:isocitrate lyase/PEP mutase family protein [Streptomyces sp. NPDC054884]|uniref:isocitrate lyase/PEP mutase family protein n=1 Tax=Streptomyces sp. ME08-AFT2 TaxID=3028683 RepID=UPI0029A71670|nr:isocitrate lyase/PEP mutase family protein [Streptomyces sp. ME08-AFT2]MDX3311386.1 isocitrate lyase/PEP mutase family protein [Streptomyces sp. ME08-AFT2]